MADEIINRVANSKLVTIDLEDYYPEGKRALFDLKDWLFEGLYCAKKTLDSKFPSLIGVNTKIIM